MSEFMDQMRRYSEEALELQEAKNNDYTCGAKDHYANFRAAETFGIDPIIGILLRMQDKMKRIQTFVEKGQLQVKGESVTDSCIDLENYARLVRGMAEEKRMVGKTLMEVYREIGDKENK